MRLATEARRLETSGGGDQTAFSIMLTGKAFRAQIDALYSDKHGSIVREIAANAHDAHIEGGWTGPFFVHAPTDIRPEFFVRDYGIGMSHEKMMTQFPRLYDSDKTETNELTGAWGLGSKSPFSYTDQFNVSCYDGSEVRHYTAAIREDGTPTLIHMGDELCTEPRGVRVSFAVDPKDFEKFAQAIEQISLAYQPNPFETNVKLTRVLGTVALKGSGWTSHNTPSSLPAMFNIRQGCVIYPLNATGGLTLPADPDRRYLIDCPLGTVRMTTSREQIDYEDKTVAYIQARIDALVKEAKKLVWKRVKDIEQVPAFFREVGRISPKFLEEAYTHPFTKLQGTTLKLREGANFYTALYEGSKGRWVYTEQDSVSLLSPPANVIVVKDISSLRDDPNFPGKPSDTSDYSASEVRRINRLARNFCDHEGLVKVTLALEVDYADRFWDACFPSTKRAETTVEEMRKVKRVVRQREFNPDSFTARGISYWTPTGVRPATEDDFKLMDPSLKVAWIEAATYRRSPPPMPAWLAKLGIEHLFIVAAHARATVKETGVAHMRDAVVALLPPDCTMENYLTLAEKVFGAKYGSRDMIVKLASSLQNDKTQFERVLKLNGGLGKLFALLQPWTIYGGMAYWEQVEREFVAVLQEEHAKTAPPAKASKPSSAFRQLCAGTAEFKGRLAKHPVVVYLSKLDEARQYHGLAYAIDGLVALHRAVPVKIKLT